MTQNDIIFIREACGHKVAALINEIVANANTVSSLEQAKAAAAKAQEEAKAAAAKAQEEAKTTEKPKTTKSKKGE